MTREALPPLFHAYETGDLDWPAKDAQVLLLGARPDLRPPLDFAARPLMIQGFRPGFLALQRMGANVLPHASGEGYQAALVVAGRHRGQNEAWLAEAVRRSAPGAIVVVAGGKMEGVSSLRKRVANELSLGGHLSKNHGETFWLAVGEDATEWAAATVQAAASLPLVEGRFHTAPGMFSHDRIDAGSRVLAEYLPSDLQGSAADFCAGWGYLSVELAGRAPAISGIDLYEADHPSLEAGKQNMTQLAPSTQSAFHWTDLATEPLERRHDVVVMNPPFHQGRAADPDIGQAMIRAASNALKPGGQLFMVANRGLPYEPALKAGFARVEELADSGGFRIWKARR